MREDTAAKGRRNVRANDYVDDIGGPPGPQLGEPRLTGVRLESAGAPDPRLLRRWLRRFGPLHHAGAVGHVGNVWGKRAAGASRGSSELL